VIILVVEDNAITRKIMRLALTAQGYEVVEAEDGRSALAAMSNTLPDLVLQDLALPDIDGLSLARRLRELPGRDEVPIVAFSAFISRLEEARATKDVFRAFIPKPILPSTLVQLVKNFVGAGSVQPKA